MDSSLIGDVYTIFGGPGLGRSTNRLRKAYAQATRNEAKVRHAGCETFHVYKLGKDLKVQLSVILSLKKRLVMFSNLRMTIWW